MKGFEAGYQYFSEQFGAYAVDTITMEKAAEHADYIREVQFQLDKLKENINAFYGSGKDINYLKGDVAEFFAAGTYNVNAAKASSQNRAFVPRSTELGSSDVQTTWGKDYSLKYYKNATESAKQQSKTLFGRYREYVSGKENPISFEEYLEKNGIPKDADPMTALYFGQGRLIPADQFEAAKIYLKNRIEAERLKRPDVAKELEEVLGMLRKKIEDPDGVSGIELTEAESRRIAQLAKAGLFDPVAEGMGLDPFIEFKFIMQDACKAGLTAAVISMVLKTAPELFKAFVYLVEHGEIEEGQIRKIGVAAVTGAGEGFLHGAISAAIVSACRMGMLGNSLKSVDPSMIAFATTIAMETIKDAFKVTQRKLTERELVNNLLRNIYVGSCAVALGALSQYIIRIPILGYMIGSFLGSVIGGFTYEFGYHLTLSFCVESGFTLFGLVEQNYTVPKEVLEQTGVEIFEYERFVPELFEPEQFEPDRFEPDLFSPEEFKNEDGIKIRPLRRGVIGVARIGYV